MEVTRMPDGALALAFAAGFGTLAGFGIGTLLGYKLGLTADYWSQVAADA
jgi:hypothetical protein